MLSIVGDLQPNLVVVEDIEYLTNPERLRNLLRDFFHMNENIYNSLFERNINGYFILVWYFVGFMLALLSKEEMYQFYGVEIPILLRQVFILFVYWY